MHRVSYETKSTVETKPTVFAASRKESSTLILTTSRGYLCVRNLDFFHLVGDDLRYPRSLPVSEKH